MISWSMEASLAIVAFSTESTACCPPGPRAERILSASGCWRSAAGRSTAMICAPGERYPRSRGLPLVGETHNGLLYEAGFGGLGFFADFAAAGDNFFSATTGGCVGGGWGSAGDVSVRRGASF